MPELAVLCRVGPVFLRERRSGSARTRQGRRPWTLPPFEKGGRKLPAVVTGQSAKETHSPVAPRKFFLLTFSYKKK